MAAIIMGICYLPKEGFAQAKHSKQKPAIIDGTVRYIYPNDSSHQIRIFGRVLDVDDEVLIGVTIQIDTFRIGTTTDMEGYFDFILYTSQIPEWNCSMPLNINISYIGFKSQSYPIEIPTLNVNPYPIEINTKLESGVTINKI